MISLSKALALIRQQTPVLEGQNCPINQADGRVLVESVYACFNQPAMALSAMDGWAVKSGQAQGWYTIVGETSAGQARAKKRLIPGQARRIFTGAAMPPGSDGVMAQEEARVEGKRVWLGRVEIGQYVRPRSFDFRRGQRLAQSGQRLDSRHLALLAAGGHSSVVVRRRPKLAIIATGNELVKLEDLSSKDGHQSSHPGSKNNRSTVASSLPALAAFFTKHGAEIVGTALVSDDSQALFSELDKMATADLIITTGGASVGKHDIVRQVLLDRADVFFDKVAVKPGKPTISARLQDSGQSLVLALPGNPVSAMIGAWVFGRVFIAKMTGAKLARPLPIVARLATPLAPTGRRREFMRAKFVRTPIRVGGQMVDSTELWIRPAGKQDSSLLTVLAKSDILVERPEKSPALEAGDQISGIAVDF